MAIPDASKGPAHVMTELMLGEVEREKRRLGVLGDAPADRISLGAPSPGVLSFREAYGSHNEVSFPRAMRLLADLPAYAGSMQIRRALTTTLADPRFSPFPQNDPGWVQVGDRLGDGRIDGIRVGLSYDSAKNGQDVRVVPRAAFNTWDSAERIIVTLSGPKGSWWRRGSQFMGSLLDPAPKGRESLRRLRRDHEAIDREYHRELTAVLRDEGDAVRLLAYSGMRTASRRILEVVSGGECSPDRAEHTHLRTRLRDLRDLKRTLNDQGSFSLRRDSPLDKAIALATDEARETGLRFDRVSRSIKEGRGLRAPAP